MNVLIDLVDCIEQRRLKIAGRGDNRAMQLLKGVKNKKFSSEEAAASALFGNKPYRSTYYNFTKRKLKELLFNTFLATVSKRVDYWEKLHQTRKKILIADHLELQGMNQSAVRLLREIFAESQKMHFTNLGRQAAQKMANLSAATGRHTEYEKFNRQEEVLWEKLQQERQAERCFFALNDMLRHQKAIDTLVIEKARDYHEKLAAVNIDTFNFRMYAYYISIIYYELNNEGAKVVQACRTALDFFENLPFELPNRTHRFFTVRMIPALLQQGSYKEAVQKLKLAEKYVLKGSRNWAGMQEYKAIAGFHLQDLCMVEEAIYALRSNRKAFASKKEEVRVLEGYLSFFKAEELSRFKVGKFLNEMPKYTADKKGMNVNILIIQILILLRRRKLSPIIDRMEALRSYTYRHLKDDPSTRRPDLFIQLLLMLSKYSFDGKLVYEKAGPLLAELKQEPRHLHAIDIEVVPYEMLWQGVIKVLD